MSQSREVIGVKLQGFVLILKMKEPKVSRQNSSCSLSAVILSITGFFEDNLVIILNGPKIFAFCGIYTTMVSLTFKLSVKHSATENGLALVTLAVC